jgi:vanillate O-demethylase ferredoxin subunit
MHYDDGPDLQSFSLDTALCGKAPDAQLYICGPEGFIGYVTGGATDRGWPTERVHVEHFNSEVTQDGDAFLVKAILSGVTVRVPSGVSIAKVLMDAGVNIPISCEQGICGSCLTPVREGLPDHRDYYQTDQEKAANTHMTPCCSRSLSPSLTLNL